MSMKLLALIHRLPCPPDRGAALRADMELRWLAERHEVWCAGRIEPGSESASGRRSLDELRAMCRALEAVPLQPAVAGIRAAASLLLGRTATESYFASRRLERTIFRWTQEVDFDAVLAFSSSMAPLALRVPARRHVLDMVDVDSRKWLEMAARTRWPQSWIYGVEARRLAGRERDWIAAMDATILVNDREAGLLADTALRHRIRVIELGMPVPQPGREPTSSPGPCGAARDGTPRAAGAASVGFLGAMDYGPNIDAVLWFAEAIWPLIKSRRKDAEFYIIGRSPVRAVRRLPEQDPRIHVTGTVPQVEPYLEHIDVSVSPLRLARGVQTKVLTAMAAGRPVVVTSCVAEGINAGSADGLLVADSPADFAEAVVGLLEDRDRARALGAAARAFVARGCDPQARLRQFEAIVTGEKPSDQQENSSPAETHGETSSNWWMLLSDGERVRDTGDAACHRNTEVSPVSLGGFL